MKKISRLLGVISATILLSAQFAFVAEARTGDVTTWLGAVYRGDHGDANNAYLDNPFGFDVDADCNLFIADTNDNVIREINHESNVITTVAGNGGYGDKNGALNTANFRAPYDVAVGPDGELYVADAENKSIRIIDDTVSTWLTGLKNPTGLLLNETTLYISETGNNRIVKATIPNGAITTVAALATPGKMVYLDGYLYVVNASKTTLSRVDVTTGAVVALKTDLSDAESVAVLDGNIYVVSGFAGLYNEIWKYEPGGDTFTRIQNSLEDTTYNHATDITFCGDKMYLLFTGGSSAYMADLDGSNPVKLAGVDRYGNTDGAKSQVMLGRPKAMVLSKDRKKVYILENHVFKSFDLASQTLTFIAGFARDSFRDDVGDAARLSGPTQMVLSPDGKKLYFADRNNNRIRQVTISTQEVSTISGAGIINSLGGTRNGYAEGSACISNFDKGTAGCAYFDRPMGIAVSLDGKTLYIADTENDRIRTVDIATGKTKLLAGSSTEGLRDGVGSAARFKSPNSLVLSRDGKTLFVLEQGNHALRKIDLRTKRVTTLLGNGKAGYRDGLFKDSRLSYPDSLALGPGNTLFISEVGVQNIRKVNLDTKTISTLAGQGSRGYVNGRANVAKFNNPRGMVMLSSSYLLVADQSNDLIRAIRL